ncbi:transcription factor grauzone-like [Anastrepha obliqua]|uniref:transcription factor grauzone-like n=1 Tax=Anastrepha obliqua TaxID=95512 RepID=UPI00240A6825|nr:transcription factor grauzone-like [Anastrepha obliqua]
MLCRLCIKYSDGFLNMFDRNGVGLGIADILGRHFWFKPHPDDHMSAVICSTCWLKVNDFHQFYVTVEQTHSTLSNDVVKKESFTELMDNEFIDTDLSIKEEFAEVPCLLSTETTGIESEQLNPFCELDSNKIVDNEFHAQNEDEDSKIEYNVPGKTLFIRYGNFYGLDSNKIVSNKIYEDSSESNGEDTKTEDNAGDLPLSSCTLRKKRKCVTRKLAASRRVGRNKSRKGQKIVSAKEVDHAEETKEKYSVKTSREDDEMVKKYIQMSCELCTFISEDYTSIRKHFLIQHPNINSYVRCCNKKLFRRLEIVQHAYKHHDPEFFKCKACQKLFSDGATLSRHMIAAHAPEEELKFHCDQCPKRFSRQKRLELHRNSHVPKNERTFICDQCPDSRFASNDLLKIHICMRHRRAVNVCHVCAKEIRDKATFEKHVRLHFVHGPKVKCTIEGCDRWFKDEDNVRRHIRRLHTKEEKAVQCDICGRESKNKSALSKHKRRVHSNIVFTCEECKKTFTRAIYLREHMTQHTGEILYKCPFCTRTFNSNANLHSHKKKMHPIELDNWRKTNNGSSQQFIE